jgi:hypothetical protein
MAQAVGANYVAPYLMRMAAQIQVCVRCGARCRTTLHARVLARTPRCLISRRLTRGSLLLLLLALALALRAPPAGRRATGRRLGAAGSVCSGA